MTVGRRIRLLAMSMAVAAPALATAADLRGFEFRGLRADMSVDQVMALFPLALREIHAEPSEPSLGLYLIRGRYHGAEGVTFDAEFGHDRRLLRWRYEIAMVDAGAGDAVLEAFARALGAPDRDTRLGESRVVDYLDPWTSALPGAALRYRIVIEPAAEPTAQRLVVDFADYLADEANTAAVYNHAVEVERAQQVDSIGRR